MLPYACKSCIICYNLFVMQLRDSNPNVFLHMRSTTIFRHSHHTISNRASVNPYQSSSGMSLYKGRDQLNIRDFDTHFHFKYCKPNFIRERTIFASFSRALSSCALCIFRRKLDRGPQMSRAKIKCREMACMEYIRK